MLLVQPCAFLYDNGILELKMIDKDRCLNMFNGNRGVLFMPLFLMAFIFFAGFYYLNQNEGITNEMLYEHVDFDGKIVKMGDSYKLSGEWKWSELPQDGLVGDDFLGISVREKGTANSLKVESWDKAVLRLLHNQKVIYEAEGERTDAGLIFTFPNQMIDNESYGPFGEYEIVFTLKEEAEVQALVSYLHTWSEHIGLKTNDPRFLRPAFEGENHVKHWVVEHHYE